LNKEVLLGISILSAGGRTTVPLKVREALDLESTPDRKVKILWTQMRDRIVVMKGTPESSFKKTLLNAGGRAAIPKHVREFLKLKSTLHKEDSVLWLQKGDEIVVEKATRRSNTTD
jgi:bifunctional DNA-binding transcriptional regulator/antitoxin component of YhaV-PrlF toxin-antitoxin module